MRRAAFPQAQRGQVQPDRPALGPPVQLRHILLTQHHLGGAQQRRRLRHGKRQVTGADLSQPTLGAQPRDPHRRLGPPGQHQPRPGRHVVGQHRQRRHPESCSRCTSSRTSTTGLIIDENAEQSLGTTDPGTELAGEASASNTRLPTGSIALSASAR